MLFSYITGVMIMLSTAQKILNRVKKKGRGWVFTPSDFADLATRQNTDVVLHRLVIDNKVRHLGRGIYDFPKTHQTLGTLSPDPKTIAQAIARKNGDTIHTSGAMAANLLGLTTQVPAKPTFVTTGQSKKIHLGKQIIHLVKSNIPDALLKDKDVALILQAFDYLGVNNIDQKIINKFSDRLTQKNKTNIKMNLRHIKNSWLSTIARDLAT